MERRTNKGKVIILGSGLGGLFAGALLSRAKLDVILFKEKRYQPSYVREGYHFIPFSNFSEIRIKPTLLQELSRISSLQIAARPGKEGRQLQFEFDKTRKEDGFQVILPNRRIDLFQDHSRSHKEWSREFPQEMDRIEKFYQELSYLPSFSFSPSRPWIKRWFSFDPFPKESIEEKLALFSKDFRQFIHLQLVSQSNLFSHHLPIILSASLLLNDEGSSSDFTAEELRKILLDELINSGGWVEEIEGVEKLEFKWRKGMFLSPSGDQRVWRGDSLILNSPFHRLRNFMGEKKTRQWSKWVKKVPPRYALVPVFLGIQEEVVPVGMRDHLVSLLDSGKPVESGNLLLVTLSPKEDSRQAPEKKRALVAEGLIPVGKWDRVSMEEHQKGVMEHLHHLIPFLDRYVEFEDFSYGKEQISCWSYPHFLYEALSPFHRQDGVVPTRLSKNLYFVGKENFPHLGLKGEILGGWRVALQILKKINQI
jgi:phytoene dehydrogenase-like protein